MSYVLCIVCHVYFVPCLCTRQSREFFFFMLQDVMVVLAVGIVEYNVVVCIFMFFCVDKSE